MSEVVDKVANGERNASPLEGFSLLGGVFAEPVAAHVNDIRNKYSSHRERTPELLMYTLELAGLIPSEEQMSAPSQPLADANTRKEEQDQNLESAINLREAIRDAARQAFQARLEMRPSEFGIIRQATDNMTATNTPVLEIIRAMATSHRHAEMGIKVDAILSDMAEAAYCEDIFRILAAQQIAAEASAKIDQQYGV